MGNKRELKLILLAVLFLCTCVIVYSRDTKASSRQTLPLKEYFNHIENYTFLQNKELSQDMSQMLKLDDYFYADFTGDMGKINLYIGYYFSADKAYAAHSPTICYPSQGWKVDTAPATGALTVGPHKIKYKEITASSGQNKELVLYWYQARLRTNTQVYRNKIDIGYNKLSFDDSYHGFVRVAVPFVDAGYEDTKKIALSFIRAFYPQFENYLTSP